MDTQGFNPLLARKVWSVFIICLYLASVLFGATGAGTASAFSAAPAVQAAVPDMTVTMTAVQGTINPGSEAAYKIVVKNIGAGDAINATLSDTLPASMAFAIQPAVDGCTIAGGMLSCAWATLAAGAEVEINISSLTNFYFCRNLDNQATVAAENEVDASYNSASASIIVSCLRVFKRTESGTGLINAGDPAKFSVNVDNIGASPETGININDPLPMEGGLHWLIYSTNYPAGAAGACNITGTETQAVSCAFDKLYPGQQISFTVGSATTLDNVCMTIDNTASASADNISPVQAKASLGITCPKLHMYMRADPFYPNAGDVIKFTVNVDNIGQSAASDIVVEDALPTRAGLHWLLYSYNTPTGATGACNIDNTGPQQVVNCAFNRLGAGQQISFTVGSETTTESCGVISNTASAHAANYENGASFQASGSHTVTCPLLDLTVDQLDQASYTRTYQWTIDKQVDRNNATTTFAPVPYNFSVNVEQTGFADSAWTLQGVLKVANPNPDMDISGVTVTGAVTNGGNCVVTNGTNVTVPHDTYIKLDYQCTYTTQPDSYSGDSMITATWDQATYHTPSGSASDKESFTFSKKTVNAEVSVTDSFNGAPEEQLNETAIVASDDPGNLTSWTTRYAREVPAPATVCQRYTNIAKIVETGQTASQAVQACPPSLVTDSALCTFDMNPATPDKDFRLIFIPDSSGPNNKLAASNPGQFYYNIFYANSTREMVQSRTVTLTLPYPFVTQGAVPLHAYSSVSTYQRNGQICLAPGAEVASSKDPAFSLSDWGAGATFGDTRTITVTLPDIPANGFAYINLHLDYGLKDTGGYTRESNDSAVSAIITIPSLQAYTFGDTLEMTHTVNSFNVFKKNPGIGGRGASATTMNPIVKARVDIFNASKKLLDTVYTDEDGWYMWNYKYTGKPTTFYVRITSGSYSNTQAITLKSNGFGVVNFLNMP